MRKIKFGLILALVLVLMTSCVEVEDEVYTKHEAIVEDIVFEYVEVKDGTDFTRALIYTEDETYVWKIESYGMSKSLNIDIIKTDGKNDDDIKITYTKDSRGNQTKQKLYIGKNKLKEVSSVFAENIGNTMRVMDE